MNAALGLLLSLSYPVQPSPVTSLAGPERVLAPTHLVLQPTRLLSPAGIICSSLYCACSSFEPSRSGQRATFTITVEQGMFTASSLSKPQSKLRVEEQLKPKNPL